MLLPAMVSCDHTDRDRIYIQQCHARTSFGIFGAARCDPDPRCLTPSFVGRLPSMGKTH
jgi:hypothetical protein